MHFAHLPAGYITSKLLFKYFEPRKLSYNRFIFWGMFGSIAPDIDLIYYYFSGNPHLDHHTYFTHFPVFWIALLLISLVWLESNSYRSQAPSLAFIFILGGFIHIILDIIAGYLWWFAPFVDEAYSLENYAPQGLLKIPHWELGLELGIILWALSLWLKRS